MISFSSQSSLFLSGVLAASVSMISAGCNRSREDAAGSAPAAASAEPYRSLRLSDPGREYLDLCQVLFNTSDRARCDAIRPSQAAQATPSQSEGLNAYYQGINQGLSGYSFDYADRNAPWSERMHRLQGASLYLAGHGGCHTGRRGESTCIPFNSGVAVPEQFNFMDDYFNLLGTFFFLQSTNNRSFYESGGHCTLIAATLGTEDEPFCHAFSRHNIVLTQVSSALRGVNAQRHLAPRSIPMSSCVR